MLKRIILADDDFDDRLLFQTAVADSGFEVSLTVAKDGEELMQTLRNTPELPKIIFLDLNMPVKNGFECLAEIRAQDKLKDKVVVMWSTSNNPEDIKKCYAMGASMFITKPSNFSKMEKLIQSVLSRDWASPYVSNNSRDFVLDV
jgi:CheY-like chemotaxis protein